MTYYKNTQSVYTTDYQSDPEIRIVLKMALCIYVSISRHWFQLAFSRRIPLLTRNAYLLLPAELRGPSLRVFCRTEVRQSTCTNV